MLKAVVKHSFIKGSKGIGRARAHINYIQYREGADRGKGPREFFNRDKEQVLGLDIKERLLEQERNGVLMHKIMLSPGVQSADLKDYTREMMDLLEREKGRPLDWYGIGHRNTEHPHIHLVIMGKDLEGGRVWLDLSDSKNLRQWGNNYLEREHQLERYLDRELENLLKDKVREIDLEYRRGTGDKEYERLMYGGDDKDYKRTGRDAERDTREWEQFDKDLHKIFDREQSYGRPKSYQQFQRESAGRLEDFHTDHTTREARERWKDLAKEDPELAQEAERELEWLNNFAKENRGGRQRDTSSVDIDRLADGLTRDEREDRDLIDTVLKESEVGDKDRVDDLFPAVEGRDKETELDTLIFGKSETERQLEPEIELEPVKEPALGSDDSWKSFENDRQVMEDMKPDDREDDDRDRGEDLFARGER
jgi:type IV secretory pathway VirD2 relaxase